ncbi:MAG: hypothetical protein K0S07_640 [Chlamydiales bacterium]|jgi:hypothetical protein|nr:hypothetical protein [Chlamydiales bacterium]
MQSPFYLPEKSLATLSLTSQVPIHGQQPEIPFIQPGMKRFMRQQRESRENKLTACAIAQRFAPPSFTFPNALPSTSLLAEANRIAKSPLDNRLSALQRGASLSYEQLQLALNFLVWEKKVMKAAVPFLELIRKEDALHAQVLQSGRKFSYNPELDTTSLNPIDSGQSLQTFSSLELSQREDVSFLLNFFYLREFPSEVLCLNTDLSREEWNALLFLRQHVSQSVQDIALDVLLGLQKGNLNAEINNLHLKRMLFIHNFYACLGLYQKESALIELFKGIVPCTAALLEVINSFQQQLFNADYLACTDRAKSMEDEQLQFESDLVNLWQQTKERQDQLYRSLYQELSERIAKSRPAERVRLFSYRQKVKWLFSKSSQAASPQVRNLPSPESFDPKPALKKEGDFSPLPAQPAKARRPTKKKGAKGNKPKKPSPSSPPSQKSQLEVVCIKKTREQEQPRIADRPAAPFLELLQQPSPFQYSRRVERWFQLAPGQPLPLEQFPEYEGRSKKSFERSRIRHAFSHLVDQVIHLPSHIYEAKDPAEKSRALHAIAQFDYLETAEEKMSERGIITWAFTAKKAEFFLHHRFFSKKKDLLRLALLRKTEELFYAKDFPSLQESQKERYSAPRERGPAAYRYDATCHTFEFEDRINRCRITIFPVPRHLKGQENL